MTGRIAAHRPMTALEWGLLLTLSVLWGGSFFFVAVALEELPPLTIVALRVALASLALMILLRVVGSKLPGGGRVWAAFFWMGLLNNAVPFTLIGWGQTHVAIGLASILNATAPLFTVVVAHFLTSDEKITAARIAGVLVGLIGVVVMIGDGFLRSPGVNLVAQLAVLAAALSYAFAGVFGRCFRAGAIAPLTAATGQVMASSVMLLPVALAVDRPWTLQALSIETVGALIGLALLSTALAYILYFRILASAGASNLLLVTFLIPVSATLLGIFVLGETMQPKHLAGMVLISLGLAAIDGRPWRELRRVCQHACSQGKRSSVVIGCEGGHDAPLLKLDEPADFRTAPGRIGPWPCAAADADPTARPSRGGLTIRAARL